jgi:hypothetical protein
VGYTADQALYASLGYGAIQVLATIPTLFLIDTKGRRTLCLIVSGLQAMQSYIVLTVRADLPPDVHLLARWRSLPPEN